MNYLQTTAPIPIDQIKEYFKDKTTFFMVDYHQSKIQGKVLLVYLSNLDIPSDIVISDQVTKEQKFELIDAYFNSNSVSSIAYLKVASAQILLQATGLDSSELIGNKVLTDEECKEFIEKYEDTIIKWIHFIDSTMLFLLKSFEDLNEALNVKEHFHVVDDPHYVGLNVVNLLGIPGFLQLYFSSDRPIGVSYFTQQFESHMFKGKSLFDYYNNESNMFIPLLQQLIHNELPLNPKEFFGEV